MSRLLRYTLHQIATEKKCGVFHVGSVDVVRYRSFIGQLIGALNLKQPEFISQIVPGTMAVLSERNDIPRSLQWNSRQIVQYLGERSFSISTIESILQAILRGRLVPAFCFIWRAYVRGKSNK